MDNNLEILTKFFMLTFIKIEEDSSNLVNLVEKEIKKSKDSFSKNKVQIALGTLGDRNKKLILEMKKFHDYFYLLHDVIVKNQEKLLAIQDKIQTVSNPPLQQEYENLVSIFEKEVLDLDSDLNQIIEQVQEVVNFSGLIDELDVSSKKFLNDLIEHNKKTHQFYEKLAKNIEQFENKTLKIAQYETAVQDLHNQFFTP